MKFSANSTELQRALARIGGVIPSKSTMPVLENILFNLKGNTLTLTGTDMEISLTASVQVKGEQDGKIAIPGKRLTDTVRSFADTALNFAIDIGSQKIVITSGNGQYNLTGENAAEYPAVPEFKGKEELTLDASLLKRIIHQTLFAVSTDELRPAMMGVLFQVKGKDLRAVSTDGHRLVRLVKTLQESNALSRDVIIPAKALQLVGRSLESGSTSISLSDTHMRFTFDSTVLISRLIEEKYPNYESVIPQDNNKTLVVSRDALMDSIRRVALYANATTRQIRFSLEPSAITIMAQDIDFGGEAREKLDCEYEGEPMDIGFNGQYVVDILSHLEADNATFKFSVPTRAGVVSPAESKKGEEVMMLVMPVRLNN